MTYSLVFIIFLMTVASFLTRRLMLTIPEKYLTVKMKRGLLYMPIGVFAGLIFPNLLLENGVLTLKVDYILTAFVCVILMLWKNNFLFSFIGSLVFIVLLQFI